MTVPIHFRYFTYELPPNAGWIDAALIGVYEQFGIRRCVRENWFSISTDHPDVLLDSRTPFSVGDAARKDRPQFTITKAARRIDAQGRLQIDAELREVKLSPLARWFDGLDEGIQQLLFYALLAAFILPILLVIWVVVAYPEPLSFWAFVGRNIRGFVGWTLALVILGGSLWLSKRTKNWVFAGVIIPAGGILMWVVPITWLELSRPPKPLTGAPEDYVQYLEYLKSSAALHFALLASIAPWLAILFKVVGLDMLATAAGLIKKK